MTNNKKLNQWIKEWTDEWIQELKLIEEEHYSRLGNPLPNELKQQLEKLKNRL